MTNGRIPIITNYKTTELVHLKVNPYGGNPWSMATPTSNFFGNIPTPIIMSGDGRVYNHIRIGAPSFHKGTSAPADSDIGIFHTLAYE